MFTFQRKITIPQKLGLTQITAFPHFLELTPVVVCSNLCTLINQKPRTLSGTGLLVQGWTMGFEPTTTGTTIRGSTAELRPPSIVVRNTRLRGHYTRFTGECKTKIKKKLIFLVFTRFPAAEMFRHGSAAGVYHGVIGRWRGLRNQGDSRACRSLRSGFGKTLR